jgi:hypothetical protein
VRATTAMVQDGRALLLLRAALSEIDPDAVVANL